MSLGLDALAVECSLTPAQVEDVRAVIRGLRTDAVSVAEVAELARELRRLPQLPDEQRQAWLTRKRDLLER